VTRAGRSLTLTASECIMARGKKKASHNLVPPPPPSHKFCTYCQVHQVVRAFAKHQKACKRIWEMDREAAGVNRTVGNDKGHGNEALNEMVDIFASVIYVLTHAI
jgi:hypothetical protein